MFTPESKKASFLEHFDLSSITQESPNGEYRDRPRSIFEEHFELLGEIGRGDQGRILKCRNRVDRQVYAIKEVRRGERELRIQSTLGLAKNYNFVQYHGSWHENGNTYIMMQCCEGNLEQFLATRKNVPAETIL